MTRQSSVFYGQKSSTHLLGFLFKKYYKKKYAWLIVVLLLIIYEIFEGSLDGILFVPETLVDKIWDVIIGMVGFFVAYITTKKDHP